MTELSHTDHWDNGSSQNTLELTQIKGIGIAKQQWLHDLGIYTVQDLADTIVDELEASFETEGHIASRHELEEWIASANALVAELLSLSVEDEAELQPEDHFAIVDPQLDTTSSTDEWETIASFNVAVQARQGGDRTEYYMTAHHAESDTSPSWSGPLVATTDGDSLLNWMLSHANASTAMPAHPQQSTLQIEKQPESPVEPYSIQQVVESRGTIDLKQVHLVQPPNRGTQIPIQATGKPLRDSINGYEAFTLKLAFELTNIESINFRNGVKPITYSIQWNAEQLTGSHRLIPLSDVLNQPIVHNQLTYDILLPPAVLAPGIYRLQVLVTLHGIPALPAFLDIPRLSVI